MKNSEILNSGAFRYYDCPVLDLSAEELSRIDRDASSWFDTSGFAMLFGSATRAIRVFDDEKTISDIGFYKVESCLRVFRRMLFVAPFELNKELLQEVMKKHRAQYASIRLFTQETLGSNLSNGWKIARQSEDAIIKLPPSVKEYLSGLGRQTRKHLPYYVRRLEREWSTDLQYVIFEKNEIAREQFEHLVGLNRIRIERRGSRSGWSEQMIENRWKLSQKGGLLMGICRNGKLVAGTLSYLHKGEAYLALIAHDPEYDYLNLGNISLFRTIEHLINHEYHALHLLWGQFFYKGQFGGEERALYEATLFRQSVSSLFLWAYMSTSHGMFAFLWKALKPIIKKSRIVVNVTKMSLQKLAPR